MISSGLGIKTLERAQMPIDETVVKLHPSTHISPEGETL